MNDEEVYVSEQGEQIISRKRFYGLNRNFVIGSGELAESVNMSDRDFPALSTRAKRTALRQIIDDAARDGLFDSEINGAVTMDQTVVILTAGGNLYRRNATKSGLPLNQRLMKYNRRLYLLPAGISVECPPGTDAAFGDVIYTHVLEIWGREPSADEMRRIVKDADTDTQRRDWMAAVVPSVNNAYIGADGEPHDSTAQDDPRTLIRITLTEAATTTDVKKDDIIHVRARTGTSEENAVVLFESDYSVRTVTNGRNVYIDSAQVIADSTTLFDLTMERKMPVLDVCFEHAGRLWGARYGENADGDFVNEIYCTALNSFENWFRYGGTADDSWACSITSEGAFTGGCALDGYPTFFKETGYYRIFGTGPDTYQMHSRECEGIQKGSEGSAVVIAGSLFYKSRAGVMRLTDALPESISDDLGFDSYGDAVGGTDGIRYYVRMTDAGRSGDERIYVFNTSTGLWHTETLPFTQIADFVTLRQFLRLGSAICAVSDRTAQSEDEIIESDPELKAARNEISRLELKKAQGKASFAELLALIRFKLMFNARLEDTKRYSDHYAGIEMLESEPEYIADEFPAAAGTESAAEREGEFPFEAVTAPVGYETPLRKYANKLYIRCAVYPNARLDIDIRYDGEDEWRHVETLHGRGKVEFHNVCVRPVRCDHFRLRLSGVGEVKILETDAVYTYGGN